MRRFTADFETNVSRSDCRVWAYAVCEIGDPSNFTYGNSLEGFIKWCSNPKENYRVYFHNLKFDGEYIISYLLSNGFEYIEDKKDRRDNTFTTLITDMGAFYSIEIFFSVKGHKTNKVTIYDSLKILNFSVDQIAKSFDLPIRKLSIDYKANRPVDHKLTLEEVDYIRNDVEIMSRALDIMFKDGHTKMTIGSDALHDFKEGCKKFRYYFPVLPLDVDHDIRQSYKGGFTWLNDCYREKETGAGITFDVNSMYPAKMVQCDLPYGIPEPYEGSYVYDPLYPLYVQKLSCAFKIKDNKIPSIQLKHTLGFLPNEYVKTSANEIVTLTLCSPDLELFFKHYDVTVFEYQGGWKFKSKRGIFTDYIEKWTKNKIKAKKEGNKAMYTISKLFLNSLYGKMGLNPVGYKKYPYLTESGSVAYANLPKEERDPIYIPVASFITAYARKYIIETSQSIREYSQKKYGYDAYVYSDTDSIHCLLGEEDVEELSKVMIIDDYELGAWKLESKFRRGKFLRQKCYIEEDYDGVINATVAGLPKKLSHVINFDNFKVGFTTEDLTNEEIGEGGRKLTYKHVKGGVLLVDTDFTIK